MTLDGAAVVAVVAVVVVVVVVTFVVAVEANVDVGGLIIIMLRLVGR